MLRCVCVCCGEAGWWRGGARWGRGQSEGEGAQSEGPGRGEGGEERNRVRDGAVKFLGIFSSQGLEALAPLDVPLQMAVMSC